MHRSVTHRLLKAYQRGWNAHGGRHCHRRTAPSGRGDQQPKATEANVSLELCVRPTMPSHRPSMGSANVRAMKSYGQGELASELLMEAEFAEQWERAQRASRPPLNRRSGWKHSDGRNYASAIVRYSL